MGTRVRHLLARVIALFRGQAMDREFQMEIDAHLAMLTDENIRRGITRGEAQRAARLRFGGPEAIKVQHRDARGLPAIENVWQDLRFAIRLTIKERWFSVAAIAALAIGIGANATGCRTGCRHSDSVNRPGSQMPSRAPDVSSPRHPAQ